MSTEPVQRRMILTSALVLVAVAVILSVFLSVILSVVYMGDAQASQEGRAPDCVVGRVALLPLAERSCWATRIVVDRWEQSVVVSRDVMYGAAQDDVVVGDVLLVPDELGVQQISTWDRTIEVGDLRVRVSLHRYGPVRESDDDQPDSSTEITLWVNGQVRAIGFMEGRWAQDPSAPRWDRLAVYRRGGDVGHRHPHGSFGSRDVHRGTGGRRRKPGNEPTVDRVAVGALRCIGSRPVGRRRDGHGDGRNRRHHGGCAARYLASVTRLSTASTRHAVSAHLGALETRRARGGITQRKAQGAHYTPAALVEHLIAEATRNWKPSSREWRLLDPSCGSGNFLVAAAGALAARTGEPMASLLATRVHGYDIDPVAIRLAREALLALLPARTGEATRRRVRAALARHVVVADALEVSDAGTFDLVLGNPPFLNQLEKGTVATRARAGAIATSTGGAVRRYADLSAAFLLTNLGRLAPKGRLGFVMPQSFLSTGDTRATRDAAIAAASLRSIWSANEALFEDAIVRVCSVVFERAKPRAVRRAFGQQFRRLKGAAAHPRQGDESWAPLLAEGFGAPAVAQARGARTVADIATATADFRDQYYGLRGAIVEDGGGPRLATTRHIDLGACSWGECEVRVLGERYRRPTIEPTGIAGRKGMDGWLESRLVPKIIVATQTRVIEAFVDERGEYAPLVPLLSVFPREGVDLWMLAAAVASPVVAARALALYAGSALSAGAIKLSSKQLLAMPLPRDRAAWKRSAVLLRAQTFDDYAVASCAAHALTARETRDVLRFWRARIG